MESGIAGTVAALVALVLVSAYFSATETAFTSMNRIRMKSLAESGNAKASLALKVADDYGRLLSTILVGNNIVNIASTSIATVMFVGLLGSGGATVSTVVMTVVILIFGEITPKTLANEFPERFAMFSAPALRAVMVVLRPVNFLFAQWQKLLTRLFKTGSGPSITEEELLTLVDEAQQEGAIEAGDQALIKSVMDFNDSKVSDILTPRVDIVGVDVDAGEEEATRVFLQTGYTRLPVYEGNVDRIIGVLHLRDYFESLRGHRKGIREMMGEVAFVTPFAKISDVLQLLQQAKSHLAVVTDEYGGTVGLVTMEDILEELVGEIWDEHDEIVEEMQQRGDGSWLVSGNADIGRVFEAFGIKDEPDCSTVNGWIMEELGRIPEEGDTFNNRGLHVEVQEVHHKRVVLCVVTPQMPQDAAETDADA